MQMAYVATAAGQIHYRRHGDGTPVVLLHWAPASGRMYAGVMPLLAAGGRDVIALDLPGYGRSHKNPLVQSIPAVAVNVREALDALGLGTFALLGGHLSASVAVEMALTDSRVSRLVLDGLLNLNPDEWSVLLHRFAGLSPMPDPEGRFRQFPLDMVVHTLTEWNPDFRLGTDTLGQVYALLNDYLEMGLEPMRAFVEPDSAPAVPPYPLAARLQCLRTPTLILSAEREPLRPGFQRSLAAVPNALGHTFAGTHPLVSGRDGEYAGVVSGFLGGSAGTGLVR
jgi:pimeloyl-ACP methyl ester carboxylesterase